MDKQDRSYLREREVIRTKIEGIRKDKIRLNLREFKHNFVKFNRALKKLEFLDENLKKRFSVLDKKKTFLNNELAEVKKDIAILEKEKSHLNNSMRKVIFEMRKEESKINELEKKLASMSESQLRHKTKREVKENEKENMQKMQGKTLL